MTAGALRRMRLSLNLKSEKYYWLNTYELDTIKAVDDYIQLGMTVYDVRANIGYMSLVFSRAVGEKGRVYAFEPLPENAERIRANINLNPGAEVIKVFQKAVSDCASQESFLVHKLHANGRLANSYGRKTTFEKQIKVETISLDDFVCKDGNPIPDLIKIDIEGGGGKSSCRNERYSQRKQTNNPYGTAWARGIYPNMAIAQTKQI